MQWLKSSFKEWVDTRKGILTTTGIDLHCTASSPDMSTWFMARRGAADVFALDQDVDTALLANARQWRQGCNIVICQRTISHFSKMGMTITWKIEGRGTSAMRQWHWLNGTEMTLVNIYGTHDHVRQSLTPRRRDLKQELTWQPERTIQRIRLFDENWYYTRTGVISRTRQKGRMEACTENSNRRAQRSRGWESYPSLESGVTWTVGIEYKRR